MANSEQEFNMKEIGRRLSELLHKNDLTARGLSKKIKEDNPGSPDMYTTISRIVRGEEHIPRFNTLQHIANALGVSLHYLMWGKEDEGRKGKDVSMYKDNIERLYQEADKVYREEEQDIHQQRTIISGVADVFGMTVDELSARVVKIQGQLPKNYKEVREGEQRTWCNNKMVSAAISSYYGLEDRVLGLKRYAIRIAGKELTTPTYTRSDFLDINKPPLKILTGIATDRPKENIDIPPISRDYVPEALARFLKRQIVLDNNPLYRLMHVEGDPKIRSLLFSESQFYPYRFTAGLMFDELNDALIKGEGRVKSGLPIRKTILPDLASFLNFRSRICAGGIGVVFALARKKEEDHEEDYGIPIQMRSGKVSDSQGTYAVIPKALHQHHRKFEDEANLHWTVFRELFEELFKGAEVMGSTSARLMHAWYMRTKEYPALSYFNQPNSDYKCEVTGFGFNAITGEYNFAVLLTVNDTEYWDTYGSGMEGNWEAKGCEMISTKDEKRICEILQSNWSAESIFFFIEGLLRLKKLNPARVSLPKIKRLLGRA